MSDPHHPTDESPAASPPDDLREEVARLRAENDGLRAKLHSLRQSAIDCAIALNDRDPSDPVAIRLRTAVYGPLWTPDAALSSPAPEPAGDGFGYPLATCPTCGEEARHYAFTMVVGTPDPNRYRCRNQHFFTPPPATPGDER